MSMYNGPIVMVCALADAPEAVPGSTFDRFCAQCGRRVMVAPSGQARLRSNPDNVIIACSACVMERLAETQEPPDVLSPNEAQIAELKTGGIPNPWRKRN